MGYNTQRVILLFLFYVRNVFILRTDVGRWEEHFSRRAFWAQSRGRSFSFFVRLCYLIVMTWARVMHIFHELGTFRDAREWCTTLLRTYPPPPCTRKAILFFLLRFLRQERLAEGSEVKIERLRYVSPFRYPPPYTSLLSLCFSL